MDTFKNMKIGIKLIVCFMSMSIISGLLGYFINTNLDSPIISLAVILAVNVIMAGILWTFVSKSVDTPIEEI